MARTILRHRLHAVANDFPVNPQHVESRETPRRFAMKGLHPWAAQHPVAGPTCFVQSKKIGPLTERELERA